MNKQACVAQCLRFLALKEICTRKAEALVQLPDVGDVVDGVKGFFGFGDKKSEKTSETWLNLKLAKKNL